MSSRSLPNLSERCPASSWKGDGPGPTSNRCRRAADWTHTVHEDEHGNRFDDLGRVIVRR